MKQLYFINEVECMKCNKLLLVLLTVTMLFGMMTPAVRAQTQTYAYDTLFDDGQDLTIAYLGGSITQGSGATSTANRWSSLLTRDFFNGTFKTTHGTGIATEVNAGVGGTPSDLGLFRLNYDVSSHNPDIVFVEFAVNDSGTSASEAGALSVQQRMEGIVRQLSKLPKQPVVIFIYTASLDGNSSFNQTLNSAKVHQEVADYYGIGSINLCEYVAGGTDLSGNAIVWEKGQTGTWTNDNTHPNDTGYAKYAEYIAKQLAEHPEKYLKKMTVQQLPKFGYEYGAPDLVSASSNRASYDEKWVKGTDQNTWSFRGSYEDLMLTTEAGAVATFDFTGRSIGLFVLRGDRGNAATYTVTNDEGIVVKSGTVNNFYNHGTYVANKPLGTTMPCSTLLINDLPYDDYTLSLTTTSVENNSNGYLGDLFAIGYYMVDEEEPAVEAPAYVKPVLDISKTDTSIARDGSVYIQAEYTDSLGTTVVNSDSVHLSGVTYTSSNQSVVTIDKNGLITPIQEGTAFISATYNGVESQKLMMIVYNTIDLDVNWDTVNLGAYANTMQSAHDSTLKFINTANVIAGGHRGNAVGQSIHHLQLNKDTMGYNDYAKGTAWKSKTNYIMNQITNKAAAATDKASVLEMWFYDDGKTASHQFWLAGITNADFLKTIATQTELSAETYKKDLRYTFAYNTSDYKFIASNAMAYNTSGNDRLKTYSVARKVGWRQFIWDASDDVTKIYVDGQLLAELPVPGFVGNQVPSVRFDRFYNAGNPVTTVDGVNYYTPVTPSHQEMKIDNVTLYGAKSTGVSISDLSVSHNQTSLSLDSESLQLTAKGVLENGSIVDLGSENAIFSSMDDAVISIDEDGTVTPVGVGLARVLISCGDYQKTLLLTVYAEAPYAADNYDGYANATISTANSAQGHGGLLNTYEFTNAKTRTGEGLSMHLKDIVISQMWNDKYKKYLEGT
ncbi:MAG: hypothetical protein E7399_03205, partial [Ruminococcaceae bacterium]|nr:hypothetical protein [Oscillospiraceae bacterium]